MAREPGADLLPRSFFGERKVFFIIMSIRFFRLNELRWVLHRSPVLVFNICSFPFVCLLASQALAASSCQVTLKASTTLPCWTSFPHASAELTLLPEGR